MQRPATGQNVRIVPLPDASRLLALPDEVWLALGRRLRDIGVTREAVGEIAAVGAALPDAARPPLRHWHLRKSREPSTTAMRLLVFGDTAGRDETERALGVDLLKALIQAKLVVANPGGLVSPFLMNLVNELYIVCDDLRHGGQAVMGAGQTTSDLAQAAYPRERVGRVLDLGCGAGTIGLLYSPQVERCIGTDVNVRALTLAQVNAALNGTENVEFRAGDLFAPVHGEAFDLIVSQPPFVALPPGTAPAIFLHGGARGDELALRLLAQSPDRLRPAGRACLLVEWPVVDDEPLERRIRAALGTDDFDLLIIELPRPDLDDYCTRYSAAQHPELGAAFARKAVALREHLLGLGIHALQPAFTVLARPVGRPGWTATVEVAAGQASDLTSSRVDALLARHDLLARGDDELRRARLRVAPGAVEVERSFGVSSEAVRLRFPPATLVPELELNPDAFLLISLVHESESIEEAGRAFAERRDLPADGAADALIFAGVREALARGILEPR